MSATELFDWGAYAPARSTVARASHKRSSAKVITYSAADVHAEIMAKVILLMESLKEEIEEVHLPMTVKKEKSILFRLGLTSTKNMQTILAAENHVKQKNDTRKLCKDRLKLISLLHKHYGADCLLMRLEDFMPLLDKYNLSCGFLKDYKGSVPNKNLTEIQKAKQFVTPNWTNIFNTGVNWIQKRLVPYYRVNSAFYELGDFSRFPLTLKPRNDEYMITSSESSRLLIAAPAQEMNTYVREYNIRTEDPIVFSVAEQGIIIWSAWGDEGDDEVMKKYKALNDFIVSINS